MIAAILQIIAAIVPWIVEAFDAESQIRRRNAQIHDSIAKNDATAITRYLSQRVDRVHAKGRLNPG
jgi:hypothetical protein